MHNAPDSDDIPDEHEAVRQTSGGGSHSDPTLSINTRTFDEIQIDARLAMAAQSEWAGFAKTPSVGESMFTAIFEAEPNLIPLFKVSSSVHSMRFMYAMNACFASIGDPKALKSFVEKLTFGHMHYDVKVEDVVIFRSSIIDLMSLEGYSDPEGQKGVKIMINYIGGAMIQIKSECKDRLRILTSSWLKANNKEDNDKLFGDGVGCEADEEEEEVKKVTMKQRLAEMARRGSKDSGGMARRGSKDSGGRRGSRDSGEKQRRGSEDFTVPIALATTEVEEAAAKKAASSNFVQHVPTVFPEMFRFNAAVMGFAAASWMNEVLLCFDAILSSLTSSIKFKENCDILAIRIVNLSNQKVNLPDYRACMLASLRSLLPKEWNPLYEVAWTWLWENVESRVAETLKVADRHKKAQRIYLGAQTEESMFEIRAEIFTAFFVAAPVGQDYFKQSNTRLHFIADSVFRMAEDIFTDPARMVDDISALGLRHVGYGIPTELFPPFVTAVLHVLDNKHCDAQTLEAFKWTFGLIQMMLVRTINDGSTLVMKAINANLKEKFSKAIAGAPRGQRASWMLTVKVGSQSISPLEWAIESGRLIAAKSIIQDLLTFRADREKYYYGMERLFQQHPDIVKMLCERAPSLLPSLLDGLIWRSRATLNGVRRANYYVKYIVVRHDGAVSQALSWFATAGDCEIISHPVNVLVSDTMWKGIVAKHFLKSRIWFVLMLLVFLCSQCILPSFMSNSEDDHYIRIIVFVFRLTTFFGSCLRLFLSHSQKFMSSYVQGKTMRVAWGWIRVPDYLQDSAEMGALFLLGLLVAIFVHEPMIRCWKSEYFPTADCPKGDDVSWWYRVLSMTAMAIHWLLIMDMSVFSTKLSAFLLVCTTVLSEVSRFLLALAFLLVTFGSAIACLKRDHPDFNDVPNSIFSLFAITLLMMPRDYRELSYDPPLLFAVFIFVTASVIMLLNLLIAQLNCSYEFIYADMLGFARLNRANVIVESLQTCSPTRWTRFVKSLRLERKLEFNEGDIGISGAIQMNEPASMNPITDEQIVRYGGKCSPEMPWPEDSSKLDRLERMELLVHKVLKKLKKSEPGAATLTRQISGSGDSGASGDESDDHSSNASRRPSK